MAVFRVEKNNNYTVMANYHLRDKALSIKALVVLYLMLSLPENCDYALAEVVIICKNGVNAIRSTVNEIEKAGYNVRNDK